MNNDIEEEKKNINRPRPMHPYDQLVRRPFQPHAMMLRIRPEIIRFQKTPCFKPESLPPKQKWPRPNSSVS